MHDTRQQTKTSKDVLLLRHLQVVCASVVLVFSFSERTRDGWDMSSPSHSIARTMLVTACTSLCTAMLAGFGVFAGKQPKDFRDIMLMVDFMALLCSIPAAVCMTIAMAMSGPSSKGNFWVLSFAFAWIGLAISIIIVTRHIWLRSRTRSSSIKARRLGSNPRTPVSEMRIFPAPAPTSNAAIVAWRQALDDDTEALLPDPEAFENISDIDAESEAEEPLNRPASPISTVANWTAVTGTASVFAFSEAPPPYVEC